MLELTISFVDSRRCSLTSLIHALKSPRWVSPVVYNEGASAHISNATLHWH